MYKSLKEQIEKLEKGSRQSVTPLNAETEFLEKLQKAPIPLKESHSESLGSRELEDIKPDSEHITTNQLKDGTYHHVFTEGWGDTSHFLSTHEDPFEQSGYLANIFGVTGNLNEYGDLDVNPEGTYQVQYSQVNPEQKGKGYGKALYLATLAHHGTINSDSTVSNKANKVWTKLPRISEGLANVTYGKMGSKEPHSATADQEQMANFLFNPKEDKLAASEKNLSDIVGNIISNFRKNLNDEHSTREEALDMLKELILRKSKEFEGVNTDILEKSWKKALKNTALLVGLMNAAHYIGETKPDKSIYKNPQTYSNQKQNIETAIEDRKKLSNINETSSFASQNLEEQSRSPQSEVAKPKSFFQGYDEDTHNKKINEFLQAISLNESSGGKNVNHQTMKHGIHRGDTAIGQYGLMPKTVQEMSNRIRRDYGSDHPLSSYNKMNEKQMRESFKNNPQHEEDMARYMANYVHDKSKGDENEMSWRWFQGHNTKKLPKDWDKHDYVIKYNKHINQVRQPKEETEIPQDIQMSNQLM